jgi:lauroyl/myristoyl acyltransferase
VRVVPRSRRFAAARTVATLLRRAPFARQRFPSHTDTPTAIVLSRILKWMHSRGVEFSLPVRATGDLAALSSGAEDGGVIAVGPRSALNPLLIRFFHEQNPRTVVIRATEGVYAVRGTRAAVPVILTGATAAGEVRRALAGGALVAGMIETTEPSRRAVELATPAGPAFIEPGLFYLAARYGARMCFTEIRLASDGTLRLMIESPTAEERQSPQKCIEAYAAFLARCAQAV